LKIKPLSLSRWETKKKREVYTSDARWWAAKFQAYDTRKVEWKGDDENLE
jgi:hypothetical protein